MTQSFHQIDTLNDNDGEHTHIRPPSHLFLFVGGIRSNFRSETALNTCQLQTNIQNDLTEQTNSFQQQNTHRVQTEKIVKCFFFACLKAVFILDR